MSLVEQTLPLREIEPGNQQQQEQKKTYRDSLPGAPKPICTRQSYDGAMYDDLYNDEIMSASSRHIENAEQPPALPQKSALRASRLLDGLGVKLPAQPSILSQTTPHDIYLSSEEDASSSADDFSDYGDDSESDESTSRRRSYEDTARAVAVVFMGRPSVVQISVARKSISHKSIEARRQSSQASLAASESSSRRMSISSSAASSISHPPRSTSMGIDLMKNKPLFLSIDPFAQRANTEPIEENDAPKTPKTPTAMFKKTLSLVKKRSRPVLNTLASGSQPMLASPSVHNLSGEHLEDVREEPRNELPTRTQTPTRDSVGPVTYNDIIRAAKKNAAAQPSTPAPPASPVPERKSRLLSGLGMTRRRSVKLTGF